MSEIFTLHAKQLIRREEDRKWVLLILYKISDVFILCLRHSKV